MLGRRRSGSGMPVHPTNNPYDQRTADALSVYNADLVPPATSYAASRSVLSSNLREPHENFRQDAAVVERAQSLMGLFFNWAWGGNDNKSFLDQSGVSTKGGRNGMVNSSYSQTVLVQLHDWCINKGWYSNTGGWVGTGSGMFQGSRPERYEYPSFRVAQINTNVTGGPGPGRMNRTPRFTAVQQVHKYTAQPRYYPTRSAGK